MRGLGVMYGIGTTWIWVSVTFYPPIIEQPLLTIPIFNTNSHPIPVPSSSSNSIAISNIYNALSPVLSLILSNWTTEFAAGIPPQANFTATADPFRTLEMGKSMERRGWGGEEVGLTTRRKREWLGRVRGMGMGMGSN